MSHFSVWGVLANHVCSELKEGEEKTAKTKVPPIHKFSDQDIGALGALKRMIACFPRIIKVKHIRYESILSHTYEL